MVNFKGKLTEAIRVKAPPKRGQPAKPVSRGPKPIVQGGKRSEPTEEDMAQNG